MLLLSRPDPGPLRADRVVDGARELRAIRAGLASPQGEGNARAGMICGIVGTGIIVLYVLAMVAYIAVVGFAVAAESLKQGNIPVR